MKKKNRKSLVILTVLLVAAFICMMFANQIQTDGGRYRFRRAGWKRMWGI